MHISLTRTGLSLMLASALAPAWADKGPTQVNNTSFKYDTQVAVYLDSVAPANKLTVINPKRPMPAALQTRLGS